VTAISRIWYLKRDRKWPRSIKETDFSVMSTLKFTFESIFSCLSNVGHSSALSCLFFCFVLFSCFLLHYRISERIRNKFKITLTIRCLVSLIRKWCNSTTKKRMINEHIYLPKEYFSPVSFNPFFMFPLFQNLPPSCYIQILFPGFLYRKWKQSPRFTFVFALELNPQNAFSVCLYLCSLIY